MTTTLAPDRVELGLDEAQFPRDAVYAAAFAFIDRCWVRLDRVREGHLSIVLRSKSAGSVDAESLAAELRNELLGQAFRQRLVDAGREFTEAVVRGAYGGVDSPAIDDLLASGTPMDDPLGIAMSWEQQQAASASPNVEEQGSTSPPTPPAPAGEPRGEQAT